MHREKFVMKHRKICTACSIVVIVMLTFRVAPGTAQNEYGGSPPYSFSIPEKIYWGYSTAEIGDSFFAYDLDGDGDVDFCFRSETYLYAYEHNGTQMWSVKIRQPGGNGGTKQAAGDIDGDGDVEVLAISNTGYIHIYDGAAGTDLDSIQVTLNADQRLGHIALARLQTDGSLDAIVQTLDVNNELEGYEYYVNRSLIAIDLATKNEIWRVDQDQDLSDGAIYTDNSTEGYWGCGHNSFLCADIDGDGLDEVVGGNAIDDDGSFIDIGYSESGWVSRYESYVDHLDAIAVGDFLPETAGLEWCFAEEEKTEWGHWATVLAHTSGVIWNVETSIFEEGYHNNDREPQALAVGNFSSSYDYCEVFNRSRFGAGDYFTEYPEYPDYHGQHPWIYTADGTMPSGWHYDTEDVLPSGFNSAGNAEGLDVVWTIDWDNSGTEYIAGKARHAYGNVGVFNAVNGNNIWTTSGLEARMLYVADVQGDSREEIIVYDSTAAGYKIKIYWNTATNSDPLPSKWNDPLYARLKQNWNYYSPGSYTAREPVTLNIDVYLEGAYAGSGSMRTDLQDNDYLPSTSPYSEDPRVVESIPADVVDWVLVELRLAADGMAVASRSAFLKNNGRIITEDNASGIDFFVEKQNSYYIVVRHRNHLAVMSSSVLDCSSGSGSWDFTGALAKFYGSDAAALGDGSYGMYAGDGNGSGIVTISDANLAISNRDGVGYKAADYNISGIVTISDMNKAMSNRDAYTRVQ